MAQVDMDWNVFVELIDRIPAGRATVSLQGEGEPSLHPMFEEMARYVLERGHRPYTILNGSRMDVEMLPRLFPAIGISIDTLDAMKAEEIGRHNLSKVLRNLDELLEHMPAKCITIMTVDLGQPLDQLKQWVSKKKFGRHVIQALTPKDDYARRYTISTQGLKRPEPSICNLLEKPVMRYYTFEGRELPCCFMKDPTDFTTVENLRLTLREGRVAHCCSGCPSLNTIGHSSP